MTILINLPFDYIFTYTLFVKKFLDYQGLITMPFIKGLNFIFVSYIYIQYDFIDI